MARQPDSLGAVVLALAVVVIALMTWVVPKSFSKLAAPTPSEPVYRAQHLNLF